MSNKTIDDFNAVVTPATTDTVLVTQASVAKKETLAQIDTLLSATTKTLTNKTLTSPVINTGVSGTAIDIDGTLAANSDTLIASQKAVKTYADTKQTLDADLTLLAGITVAANQFIAKSSAGAIAAKAITDFALTLLDDADAATVIATLGSNVIPLASLSSSATEALNVQKRVAKAWVNFLPNGTIVDDFNVATITDNGTGDWTINFTANMTNDDYAFSISLYTSAATRLPVCSTAPTVSALRVVAVDAAFNVADPTTFSAIVFSS